MIRRSVFVPVLPVLLVVLAGCAAGRGPARTPPPGTASAEASDGWASKSWEDRHDTMTFLVLPNMARLFQRFDGALYPTLTCRTCHGQDAEEVRYKMPHGLTALDPAHLPDSLDADPRRAQMAKFMIEEVTPDMANLLGVPAFHGPLGGSHGPRKSSGFSCFNCHPAREAP